MRKNGVNRTLQPIVGGVCAPSGFQANAVICGFDGGTEKPDLALVAADKRCPAAFVCSDGVQRGAPVKVTQKRVKSGYAQAVIVNSGAAIFLQPDGEILAENVCRRLERISNYLREDILIASTGKIDRDLRLETFEKGLKPLVAGLAATAENSTLAARALMTTDTALKEISYTFELGAYTCRIGAIFKGSQKICPNMATVLGIITTDVNISPAALQRALNAVVKDTFNALNGDGETSPNDMLCIFANGNAGNYQIDRADSEYEKFVYALRETTTEMCRQIAADGGLPFVCKVKGAKSKRLAREIATRIVGAEGIKKAIGKGEFDIESLLYAVYAAGAETDFSKARVTLSSVVGKVVVFEGEPLQYPKEILKRTLFGGEVEIRLETEEGNYTAEAFGRAVSSAGSNGDLEKKN